MDGLKIDNLERDSEGVWNADVSVDDLRPCAVHKKWGAWMIGFGSAMREVLPEVAAELQKRVLKLEKRERLDNGEQSDV